MQLLLLSKKAELVLTVTQLRLLLHCLQPELELVVLRGEPRRVALRVTKRTIVKHTKL